MQIYTCHSKSLAVFITVLSFHSSGSSPHLGFLCPSFAFRPTGHQPSRQIRAGLHPTDHLRVVATASFFLSSSHKSSLHDDEGQDYKLQRNKIGDDLLIPPNPRREEDRVVHFGIRRNASVADPYGWMRDNSRTDPEVRAHVEAENMYTQKMTRGLQDLQETLEREFQQTVSSNNPEILNVFYQGDYVYYTKRVSSQPYVFHCRKQRCNDQEFFLNNDTVLEEVILDENEIAGIFPRNSDDSYLAVHTVLPSPSHRKIAFSLDTRGNECYTIMTRDMDSAELSTVATNTSGNFIWGATDQQLHFVCYDSDARFRPSRWMEWSCYSDSSEPRIRCHREELDERTWCQLEKSSDGNFILWKCSTDQFRKIWALDLSNDRIHLINPPPKLNQTYDLCWYDVDHGMHGWWMISNHLGHDGLALLRECTTREWEEVHWVDNIGGSGDDDRSSFDVLESMSLFSGYLILYGRNEGLSKVWLLDLTSHHDEKDISIVGTAQSLQFDESAHFISLARQQDYSSGSLVLSYESMVEPPEILDVCLHNPIDRRILYRKAIPGYNSDLYACERRWVDSRDAATKIPISMVYEKTSFERNPCPLHLLGYGAYGHCLEPSFSSVRLPLLNRGVTCVIAHVRGGGELGRSWHQGGSLHNKSNSIYDFVDVASYLVESGLTTEKMLGIEGRSAGGLLVARALNETPELYKAALLVVPFLDPLVTMADSSLPLTAVEYGEWGNPHFHIDFENMNGWSPIQNIQHGSTYPSILAVGGLYDNRVQYWEPLKYIAALRHATRDDSNSDHCVWIDTTAGHSSGGHQGKYWKRLSTIYAFLLNEISATERTQQSSSC